jgi:hypothetical protein
MENTCNFDKDGKCFAYACYSDQECSAKDGKNINYATVEEIKKRDELQHNAS